MSTRAAILFLSAASLVVACAKRDRSPLPSAPIDPARIALLSKRCDEADPNARDGAVRALIGTHEPNAYDALVRAALRNWKVGGTEGPGWKWLEAAGSDIVPAMARVFSTSAWPERMSLLDFVGREHLVAGDQLIRLALADSDADVADYAVYVIGVVPLPNALKELTESLRSTRAHRRDSAIAGLTALGDPRAVRPLVAVLVAPDEIPFAMHDYDNAGGQPATLHDAANRAIDKLAGGSFHGDVSAIRSWLAQHPNL